MTTLAFVGQAPSRQGDGRAFSGPSGNRLCRLLDLTNYEALANKVELRNLLDKTVEKSPSGRGDTFDPAAAQAAARSLTLEYARRPELVVILACGHQVYRSITRMPGGFYRGVAARVGPAQFLDIWCFPHPSGASAYWNEPKHQAEAKAFLKRLVTHYGIDMAR